MSDPSPPPQTPPLQRNSNLTVVTANPPSPLRSKSTFAKLENSCFIIDDDDEDEDEEEEDTESEEESPIKNRELWKKLARKGGASEDSSFAKLDLSGGTAGQEQSGRRFSDAAIPRKDVRIGDSPSSRRSSTSIRGDRYVPPHLRSPNNNHNNNKENVSIVTTPYLPSIGKNSFSSFDRSAVPESEDHFYALSNERSFAFSRYSTTPSTPETSREMSRNLRFSPSPLKGVLASPPPRLLSRSSRLDTSSFEHPRVIAEEEDALSDGNDAGGQGGTEELEEGEEPLGPVFPLESVRTEAAKIDAAELKGIAEKSIAEECSGCGASPDLSFVILLPCRHSSCPDCLNSMINGAAHKPPRPSDCFSCSHTVTSFDPCHEDLYAEKGGVGLAQTLAITLQSEEHKERSASRHAIDTSAAYFAEDELEYDRMRRLSRSSRRRSSVVAAAIAASLVSRSRSKSVNSPRMETTSTRKASGSNLPTPPTPFNRHNSLADLPADVAIDDRLSPAKNEDSSKLVLADSASSPSQWSNRSQGTRTPLVIDWASEPMPIFDAVSSDIVEAPPQSSSSSSIDGDSQGSVESTPCRKIEWPVVRLDNVPWEITIDEIEQWLPEGTLASDVDLGIGIVENDEVERVPLAVHVLCNRLDGKTLNQAFVECSSVEAAKTIVRQRDGSRLRGRPVHVTMSSQGELLSTIFPTYKYGFEGLDAVPGGSAAKPCPILLQSELTGLLNLCRLENSHALKAPERPYFNFVSILEKLPWHQSDAYNSKQVVRLFEASLSTIKTLESVRDRAPAWREILTVLVDSILRCPQFLPRQKAKILAIAGGLGFVSAPSKTIDVFYAQPSSSRPSLVGIWPSLNDTFPQAHLVASMNSDTFLVGDKQRIELGSPFVESSSPSPDTRFNPTTAILPSSHKPLLTMNYTPTPSASYAFPTPSPRPAQPRSSTPNSSPSPLVHRSRQRRCSSVSRRLNIDKALVLAVANELGVALA